MPMVAKNRRSRRARKLHATPKAESRPASPSESPEQLSERLQNLRGEIAAAKADAERRTSVSSEPEQPAGAVAVATEKPELKPPYPRPDTAGRGRKRFVALGTLLGLAVVGVVVGILVTSSNGTGTSSSNAVSVYMKHNIPAGTAVGVIGGLHGVLPSGYQSQPVAATSTAGNFHYLLAPDPLTKAGPALTTFIEKNATLLAVSPSQATLWRINVQPGAPTSTVPKSTPSTPPPPTVPVTAAPTTAPPTTAAPTTTVPPTTAPPVTTPPTTAPPATTPATTVPKAPTPTTPAPTPTTPSSPAPTATPHSVTVQMGESFWSIAATVVQQRLGTTPTNAQVAQYWTQLIAANAHNLPHPGDPDLIYVGQTLVVPSG